MESIPPYQGKPTVYLDQNILDLFTKYGVGDFGQNLLDNYQVVYSDETLKEIRRSKGFEDKFLNVLKELNASHLKLIVEQPNFVITGNATITKQNPFESYKEYCQKTSEYQSLEHAMQQSLFKFSGGRKGESIADIHNEQITAFTELMDSMLENTNELPAEVQSQIVSYTEVMKSEYKSTLAQTERMMIKDIPDDKNWDGIKDFRSHVGVGPKQLNNIEPPNVLVKIWNELKKTPPYFDNVIDIDDFFQLKKNPIYPEQPYYKHQKVTAIYNMLNTLGYYPDSNVHKERRFTAAMSDNGHASIASFSNILLSNDESFIKKVRVAYEYLEISTIAQHVVINYA